MARFAAVPFASPLHDAAALSALRDRLAPTITRLGGEVGPPPGPRSIALPLVLTGGTEAQIVEWHLGRGGEPIVLIAHPDQNSLPAALEALARIQQLGGRGRIVYLGDDRSGGSDLDAAVTGIETHVALRGFRLGLVGRPSDWLVASSPDPALVTSVWGPQVVPIPVERLIAGSRGTGATDEAMWEGATAVAIDVRRLAPAAAVHRALAGIVAEERLSALSVRCFDLIEALDTTGCIALSRLNDSGVVAGCEGDLPSTLAMLWVQQLVAAPAWMANPARVDRGRGTLLLAHCTVPQRLVSEYSLDTHFESDRGIGIAGSLIPGSYTLVRIGGTGLDRLWLAEGTVAGGADPDPGLCRTQVEVDVGVGKVDELLAAPLGNHLVMVRGHHAENLRRWHDLYV